MDLTFFQGETGQTVLVILAVVAPAALVAYALLAGPRAWLRQFKDELKPLAQPAKCQICESPMEKSSYAAVWHQLSKLFFGVVILASVPLAFVNLATLLVTVPLAGVSTAGYVRSRQHVLRCTSCGHFVPRLADLR